MYSNSIFGIIALAQEPWDRLLPFDDYTVSAGWYASELKAAVIPPAPTTVLRFKHVIMGIYELGCHVADGRHFNYEVAFLSVNGRVAGIVSLENQTPGLVGGHNATAYNSSSVEVMQVAYSTSVADEPGIFVDPGDVNFVIYYNKLGGNRIYIETLFTAFLDALANASPNDVDELGASVYSCGGVFLPCMRDWKRRGLISSMRARSWEPGSSRRPYRLLGIRPLLRNGWMVDSICRAWHSTSSCPVQA